MEVCEQNLHQLAKATLVQSFAVAQFATLMTVVQDVSLTKWCAGMVMVLCDGSLGTAEWSDERAGAGALLQAAIARQWLRSSELMPDTPNRWLQSFCTMTRTDDVSVHIDAQ
eukprot:2568121-Amphidinium_carterae.1